MTEAIFAASNGEFPTSDDLAVIDQSLEDDSGLIVTGASSLSYFGADFDVQGLVRRLDEGDIIVPRFDPDESQGSTIQGFQRQQVWPHAKMEAFIESLLLGWPVPSIFLVVEPDQRYLVLDGQQRLTALAYFYRGKYPDGRPFVLKDVAEHLKGANYDSLDKESRRKLNNTFIQAIVIEPVRGDDHEKDEGRESVYRLFGRLNSGGVSLTAQEIRVALFRGPVIDWIRDLNADQNWRRLFGAPHRRLKDHEMILRSLAMQEAVAELQTDFQNVSLQRKAYTPAMSSFLNAYLTRHRQLGDVDVNGQTEAFGIVCESLVAAVGRDGVKINGRLNAAHIDAILSVLMNAAMSGDLPPRQVIVTGINELREDVRYGDFITKSTSHRDSVVGRLELASMAFNLL